ncbi:hypothetical protein PNOK_0720200 [Pyrrhoderma noxium]|uniref:Uncharacterized protein n=1 Tax=Pyrrhoderma noxium TaxID=2282107 RepID=A0A286UC56_9AGAM|nr:hypothetical protein PNOK_0720200 [Pyrrhoderma noxium]
MVVPRIAMSLVYILVTCVRKYDVYDTFPLTTIFGDITNIYMIWSRNEIVVPVKLARTAMHVLYWCNVR